MIMDNQIDQLDGNIDTIEVEETEKQIEEMLIRQDEIYALQLQQQELNERIRTIPVPQRHSSTITAHTTLKSVDLKGQSIIPRLDHYDYSLPPTDGRRYIEASTEHGQGFFFPHKNASCLTKERAKLTAAPGTSLLAESIYSIMDRLELNNDMDITTVAGSIRSRSSISHANESNLWVNKYSPQRFTDLISSVTINKMVLQWIKEWDYCVFGNQPIPSAQPPITSFNSNWIDKPRDRLFRPDKKILMLAGPPGLGKTSLAHIIARQAGYQVFEVNASDDRTGTVMQDRLKMALESNSVKQTKKPTLVIIDEIDGVYGGGGDRNFIEQLVRLAETPLPNPMEAQAKKVGKKRTRTPLLRPIICICNDQFAPVLKPLRSLAKIITVEPVTSQQLILRLREICIREKLTVENRALLLLAESTNYDLRSSINALQMLSTITRHINMKVVEQQIMNGKDVGRPVFHVWSLLFQRPNAKRIKQAHVDLFRRYTHRLTKAIEANGEYERIIDGCFENYPNVRYHDHAMKKPVMIAQWFHLFEKLHSGATGAQHHTELYPYLSYPAIAIHPLFAGSIHQSIAYPKTMYSTKATAKSHQNLLDQWRQHLNATTRRSFTRHHAHLELLPYLLRIISPSIKSINAQLIKVHERPRVHRVVALMLNFGLLYTQERLENGQFYYRLEPPLEAITQFTELSNKSVLPKSYATRQMLSQLIEVERLARKEQALTMAETQKNNNTPRKPLKSATIQPIIKVPVDFFGRPIQLKSNTNDTNNDQSDVQKQHSIWYTFNEGFSNAVRRPVTIKELLV
ncbi:hypothetical protein BDF19DRAFT_431474 [Syncephalis fuscata]|nr:hypothetical protein BDF19DRAFT_431474 [Syncephalis fuscata]